MPSLETVVGSMMVDAAREEPMASQTSVVQTAQEPKRAFADTPAMVKARQESLPDNTSADGQPEADGTGHQEVAALGSESVDSTAAASRPKAKRTQSTTVLPQAGPHTPAGEAPNTEAPHIPAPHAGAAHIPAPDPEAPHIPAPDPEAPHIPAPDAPAARIQSSEGRAAHMAAPDAAAPPIPVLDTGAPHIPAPDGAAPRIPVPDTGAPHIPAPNAAAPPIPVPDTGAPHIPAPDAGVSRIPVRDTAATQISAPRRGAPVEVAQRQIIGAPAQAGSDAERVHAPTPSEPVKAEPAQEQAFLPSRTGRGGDMVPRAQPLSEKEVRAVSASTPPANAMHPGKEGINLADSDTSSVELLAGQPGKAGSKVPLQAVGTRAAEATTPSTPNAKASETVAPKPAPVGAAGQPHMEPVPAQPRRDRPTDRMSTVDRPLPEGQPVNADARRHASAVETMPASEQEAPASRSQGRPVGLDESKAAMPLPQVANAEVAQTSDRPVSSLGSHSKGAGADVEPFVALASEPSVPPQRVSTQHSFPAGVEGPPLKGPAQTVSEQVLDSMQTSFARGDRQLLIRLEPPELGSVFVRFREHGEQIHGILEVSKSEVRYDIERALPEVIRHLQESGIPVRRLDVTIADPSDKGLGRESSQQDVWSQQQGTDEFTDHRPRSFGSRGAGGTGHQQRGDDNVRGGEDQVREATGRIDLLM